MSATCDAASRCEEEFGARWPIRRFYYLLHSAWFCFSLFMLFRRCLTSSRGLDESAHADADRSGNFRLVNGKCFLVCAAGNCGGNRYLLLVAHAGRAADNCEGAPEDSAGGAIDGPARRCSGRTFAGDTACRRHYAGRVMGDRG